MKQSAVVKVKASIRFCLSAQIKASVQNIWYSKKVLDHSYEENLAPSDVDAGWRVDVRLELNVLRPLWAKPKAAGLSEDARKNSGCRISNFKKDRSYDCVLAKEKEGGTRES